MTHEHNETPQPNAKTFEQVLADAENYGDALNEAGWAFISMFNAKPTMIDNIDSWVFNNAKSMLRSAIAVYLKEVYSNDNN